MASRIYDSRVDGKRRGNEGAEEFATDKKVKESIMGFFTDTVDVVV